MAQRLSRSHQLFVNEYIQHGDASKAAIAAGYTASNAAPRLMQMPKIAAAIKHRQKCLDQKAMSTVEKKIEMLWDLSTLKTAELRANPALMPPQMVVQMLDMLNKLQGHYAPEKNINLVASVEMDADINEAKALLNEIVEKNKKEY